MSDVPAPHEYEYERVAFLEEGQFDELTKLWTADAEVVRPDDKISYFFPLPGMNLSVAQTSEASIVKFKDGDFGQDLGYREFPPIHLLDPADTELAVELFSRLTDREPQVSEQFRTNYELEEGVEASLKYTQTWGFHVELEVAYTLGDDEAEDEAKAAAEAKIQTVAEKYGIRLLTDEEIKAFGEQFEQDGEPKGKYAPDEFRALYRSLFKLAAIGRLPEQQHIDALTVEWIDRESGEFTNNAGEITLPEDLIAKVAAVELDKSWYPAADRAESIHGDMHGLRTAVFAELAAREMGMDNESAHEAFLAGLFHDIRRVVDKDDEAHGQQAAAWIAQNAQEIPTLRALSPESLERIQAAIANHDISPESLGELSGDAHKLIEAVRIGDALDRFRLPKRKWWIDMSYLRHEPSKPLVAFANRLVVNSERKRLDGVSATQAIGERLQPSVLRGEL